ncbi:dnaJ homolog subfamily C member 17 [Onthophagus taurus]|uniref:dnaJ homolog subfamily C member 17 n=1 Tax=Onthophagus taurus TaxID=166361 RepID=UPI0039BE3243
MESIENENLYKILQISIDSSTSDIKKAYRKKALKLHPDKNPDNPDAAKEFHKLSKILEILTDESARKAYDRVLKARQEAQIRHQALDSKRKKLKEDLDAREQFKSNQQKQKSAEQLLKEEIERLRKEGSKQVEEEIALVTQQIFNERNNQNTDIEREESDKFRIKIKWKANKNDDKNGGYNEEILRKILLKYGDINVLVMSSKKKGSALIEYKTKRAAEMAIDLEKGLIENPLNLEWVNPPISSTSKGTTIKDSDFESIVLMKLRQAEERKKLIAQMMAEDKND